MDAVEQDPSTPEESAPEDSDAPAFDPADDLADADLLLLDEVDEPLVLQVWEPTGEPRVDEALDLLAQLDPDDVHQHADVFAEIHQRLHATLTDLDSAT